MAALGNRELVHDQCHVVTLLWGLPHGSPELCSKLTIQKHILNWYEAGLEPLGFGLSGPPATSPADKHQPAYAAGLRGAGGRAQGLARPDKFTTQVQMSLAERYGRKYFFLMQGGRGMG